MDAYSWALGAAGIYFITESNGGKGMLFFYEFDTRKVLSLMPLEKRAVEPALSPDGTIRHLLSNRSVGTNHHAGQPLPLIPRANTTDSTANSLHPWTYAPRS